MKTQGAFTVLLATMASVTGALGAACGGGAPPPAATTPGEVTKPVATAAADVSPVAEPERLVALGRVNKPDALIRTVGGWVNLPLPGGAEILRSVGDPALADAIDFGQPVDAAVILGGTPTSLDPLYAVAMGVRSFEDAKRALSAQPRLKIAPAPNGGLEVRGFATSPRDAQGVGGEEPALEDEEEDDANLKCVLAHAPAGARLVCGPGGGVDALTPYLARTASRAAYPSDVHVELRLAPVRKPMTDFMAGLPALAGAVLGSQSAATREAVSALMTEIGDFVIDTDVLAFDANATSGGLELALRTDLVSARSAIAQLAASGAAKKGRAPETYWHLPGDVATASFHQGSDPKIMAHAREIFGSFLFELLSNPKDAKPMAEADRKTIRELLETKLLPFASGPMIYGAGFDAEALEKALAAMPTPATDEARRRVREQALGWTLVRVEEPIGNVGRTFKDLAGLFARPSFQAWVKAHASEAPKIRQLPTPSAVVLPKETVHLELTVPVPASEERVGTTAPGAAAKTGKPMTAPKTAKPTKARPTLMHVFAVPDGAGTWIAVGVDEKLTAQKAAASLASAPRTGTLGEVSGLGTLHDATDLTGGGLTTLKGFAATAASFAGVGSGGISKNALRAVARSSAPAMIATSTVDVRGGKTTASAKITVPAATLSEAVRAAMSN